MFIQCNKNIKKYMIIFLFIFFNQLVIAQVNYQSKKLYHHDTKLTKPISTSYELGFYKDGGLIFGPAAINVDKDGNVYILDTQKRRIIKTDPNGNYMKTIKIDEGMKQTGEDLCIDHQNNIYVLDQDPKICKYYKNYIQTKNSSGLNLCEIRKYDKNGILLYRLFLAIERDWRRSNQFAIIQINVDYKQKLYFEYNNHSLPILIEKKYQNTEYGNLFIGKLGRIFDGTIDPWDKECKILTTRKNKTLKKSIGDKEYHHILADIDKFITEDFKYERIIKQDLSDNSYVLFNDKMRLKKKNNKYDNNIIMIFDKNGKQVTTLDQLPSNKYIYANKNITIDNEGNIFYMAVNEDGIELIKYYK